MGVKVLKLALASGRIAGLPLPRLPKIPDLITNAELEAVTQLESYMAACEAEFEVSYPIPDPNPNPMPDPNPNPNRKPNPAPIPNPNPNPNPSPDPNPNPNQAAMALDGEPVLALFL